MEQADRGVMTWKIPCLPHFGTPHSGEPAIHTHTPVVIHSGSASALACAAFFLAVGALAAGPALADFRLCNNTGNRVGISVGYKENEGWTTEGWWNIPARSCETVLRGALVARFYYIYAVDYDRGGEWSGQAFMCTREKEFTIRGTDDCLARGYDRTGFFEVDTGDQPSWTVQLTESGDQAPMEQPLQSRVPMLQGAPGTAKPGTPPPTFRSRN